MQKFVTPFILILLVIITTGCTIIEEPKIELSELQIIACETANNAGTCNTRLAEVGIVTKENCCSALDLCCE